MRIHLYEKNIADISKQCEFYYIVEIAKVSVLLCNFVAKTYLCSFYWLYLSLCFVLMFIISAELGHHSCLISADWSHHSQVINGLYYLKVIIVSSRHFTKDDWWTEPTTESTKHQEVEATNFVETHEVKKATSFEKLHEMKDKRKNIWDRQSFLTSEAKIYLVSKNIIYHKTQNT